jgi:hypothetical protein
MSEGANGVRQAWLLTARLVVAAIVLGAAVAQAAVPAMAPGVPACLAKDGNSLVSLRVVPETGWSSVRVYFRKSGSPDFYYLEMRSDGNGQYWAVLPRPENGTTVADIQFAVRDVDGVETRSALQQVSVTSDCTSSLSPGQESFARNLVVGETAAPQAGSALLGWQCTGVVSRIGVGGQLRYDDLCRSQVIAAALASEANHRLGLWIPLAAAGGVIGGVIVHHDDHETCSCYVPHP